MLLHKSAWISWYLVQDKRLDVQVGFPEDGPSGGFVDPSGLHPNKAILHNVDASNSVLTPEMCSSGVTTTKKRDWSDSNERTQALKILTRHCSDIGRVPMVFRGLSGHLNL